MIKVLIVDDSAIVRQVLNRGLNEDPQIEVVGTASDPYAAREKIVELKPDVLTLDIEMPRMDGLTFLKKLMDHFPLPVIIVSSVTTRDNQAAIKALEIGAFEVVNKPGGSLSAKEVLGDISMKIRQAYKLKKSFLSRRQLAGMVKKEVPEAAVQQLSRVKTTQGLIAIGSSTGGTLALEYLFSSLPANLPPILVVQHMPLGYTAPFAERLNSLSKLSIKEAENGEILHRGTVYIARAGIHMTYEQKGISGVIRFREGKKVSYQKPAVDVLFQSLVKTAGENVLAVILTGMGSDGADGMLKLKQTGALTVAQDKASSIVWGMPKAAVDAGAAVKEMPLDRIPEEIIRFAIKRGEL